MSEETMMVRDEEARLAALVEVRRAVVAERAAREDAEAARERLRQAALGATHARGKGSQGGWMGGGGRSSDWGDVSAPGVRTRGEGTRRRPGYRRRGRSVRTDRRRGARPRPRPQPRATTVLEAWARGRTIMESILTWAGR